MKLCAVLLTVVMCIIPLGSCAETNSRGYRNHNPGNLEKTSIQWKGQVNCKDTRFACFVNPYYGVRAMTKTLITYKEKHKLSTIKGIVNRWAPSTENDTNSYSRFLTYRTGSISEDFYNKLPSLIFNMIYFENGSYLYPMKFIEEVVRDTIGTYDTLRINSPRGSDEAVVNEVKERRTETYSNYGSFPSASWSERIYQEHARRALHMDEEIYSYHGGVSRICTPEGSSIFSRRWSGLRVDRVGTRVSFLYRW